MIDTEAHHKIDMVQRVAHPGGQSGIPPTRAAPFAGIRVVTPLYERYGFISRAGDARIILPLVEEVLKESERTSADLPELKKQKGRPGKTQKTARPEGSGKRTHRSY